MRRIVKRTGYEPASLTDWKRSHPNSTYKDLGKIGGRQGGQVRKDIRHACSHEQYYLCAYCCRTITGQYPNCMNEHVVAQSIDPSKSLDFSNIVASCTVDHQCDRAHGCQPLPLTPFDPECETDFVFNINGKVHGETNEAIESIRVLNLNKRELVEERKQILLTLLTAIDVENDDEFIPVFIDDLLQPSDNGKLSAFSPVIVNVLRQWIA